jgi:prepilin-type N-terminal cleavage/methylation domain-containing protein
MRQRGFNLLELAVASALAGIIATAAVGAFAALNRQIVRMQHETLASDNAKTLVDFLVSDLQAIGGGSVRPWAALLVEDGEDPVADSRCSSFNCAGGHVSDRISYATVVAGSPTCPISATTGTTVQSTGVAAACCLQKLVDVAGFGAPPTMHAVLTSGNASRHVVLTGLNTLTCEMGMQDGPLTGANNVDADNLIDSKDSSVVSVDFTGGSISGVEVTMVYLDEASHTLFSAKERSGFNGSNVTIDPFTERKRLANDVYDLQVQLGFDGNPGDGRLVDTNNTADEWLYNTSGDVLPAAIRLIDLRMVAVGVVVGVNVRDQAYQSGAQVVGGPPRASAGIHMRGAMGKAALRNIFVFF